MYNIAQQKVRWECSKSDEQQTIRKQPSQRKYVEQNRRITNYSRPPFKHEAIVP